MQDEGDASLQPAAQSAVQKEQLGELIYIETFNVVERGQLKWANLTAQAAWLEVAASEEPVDGSLVALINAHAVREGAGRLQLQVVRAALKLAAQQMADQSAVAKLGMDNMEAMVTAARAAQAQHMSAYQEARRAIRPMPPGMVHHDDEEAPEVLEVGDR